MATGTRRFSYFRKGGGHKVRVRHAALHVDVQVHVAVIQGAEVFLRVSGSNRGVRGITGSSHTDVPVCIGSVEGRGRGLRTTIIRGTSRITLCPLSPHAGSQFTEVEFLQVTVGEAIRNDPAEGVSTRTTCLSGSRDV